MKPILRPLAASLLVVAASPAQGALDGAVPRMFGWSNEGSATGARFGSAIAVLERTSLGVPVVVSVERAIDTVKFLDVRHGAVVGQVRGSGRINYGRTLAAGDFDGDGLDELAIGADTGVTVVDDRGALEWWFNSPANSGLLLSLASTDLDRDGYDDLLVGYPFAATAQGSGAGRIDLYSGQSRSLTRSVGGVTAGATLGFKLGVGELSGQPVCFASAPNTANAGGGTGSVYAYDEMLRPVFSYDERSRNRRLGSGFLSQRGDHLAVGSTGASLSTIGNEGNVAVIDLAAGAIVYEYDGVLSREFVGATGAYHPGGRLYFSAIGTQNQGVVYEWDYNVAPVPTALFQGDIGTGVRLHGRVYEDLLGDGRPIGLMGQPGAVNPAGRAAAGRVATLTLSEQTLFPSIYRIPSGGTANLDVRFGGHAAGRIAAVLGSLSGVGPTPLPFGPNKSIALTFDWFTTASTALFAGTPLVLDANGEARFVLQVPVDPSIPPLDVSFAAVAFDPNAPIFSGGFESGDDAHTLRLF